MADHQNTIAETAPIKVRFKHAGVADERGIHRPVCRPRDLKLQTVKHEKDVTCPHCIQHIADFKNWMALQIAAGNVPESELSLEEKVWAILNRDGASNIQALCDELKVTWPEIQKAAAKLMVKGSVILEADGKSYRVAKRG